MLNVVFISVTRKHRKPKAISTKPVIYKYKHDCLKTVQPRPVSRRIVGCCSHIDVPARSQSPRAVVEPSYNTGKTEVSVSNSQPTLTIRIRVFQSFGWTRFAEFWEVSQNAQFFRKTVWKIPDNLIISSLFFTSSNQE